MKKNSKLVLGLLSSILCIGAIGGLGYGIYELSNQEEKNDDRHIVNLNYYKDDVIDVDLSSNFEVEDGFLLNLNDYKIDIENYKFYRKNYESWILNVTKDINVDFYYISDEGGNEDDDKLFDISVEVYLSNEGIDGSYKLDDIYNLSNILDYQLSITNIYSLLKEEYSKFKDYNLNFSSSYMDGFNFGIYLYNGKPVEEDEDKTYTLAINLFVDYKDDDDGYLGGQSYSMINANSSITLINVLSFVWASDQTIPRDVLIDYDLSTISGKVCNLYIYEQENIEEPEEPVEYISEIHYLCHSCGLSLVWSDVYNSPTCSDDVCGGDGYYKKIEYLKDSHDNHIVKTNVLVEKGDWSDLDKSDFSY